MITREQRETIGRLIESKATALATLQQADFASEFKANAAFDYVRASDELEAYLDGLVEQESTTAADADGWIEWGGGRCPVSKGVRFELKFRDGSLISDASGERWSWSHKGKPSDIIAYRIFK